MHNEAKEPLIGKTLDELRYEALSLGMPAYAARQLAGWLYTKRVESIDEMLNISLAHREKLKAAFCTGRLSYVNKQTSSDGTVKYLFPASGNRFVESVYIPDRDRATLCVSSQAGCKMNCRFCMTGKQGFNGQLQASDIINQILSIPESAQLSNVVFMGMGEPLDNVNELFKVLDILTSDYGFAWSPKRITVSTVGVLSGLKRFLAERQEHLAVSLHSPFPEERLSWMPIQKASPLNQVLDLIRQYDFSHQRRVSFEYILFGGLNDNRLHADALCRLLKNLPCRVNLIRYHRIPDIDLPPTDEAAAVIFRDHLTSKGITCTIRASRGEDILAACGMLATEKRQKV